MIQPKQNASGNWTAQVRLPDGRKPRITEPTEPMWWTTYRELMADIKVGTWTDPQGGKRTVAWVWEHCRVRGDLEASSESKHDTTWRNHVEPKWGEWPIGKITAQMIGTWREEMVEAGKSASLINSAMDVLSRVYKDAEAARLYGHNPVRGVRRKKRSIGVRRVLRSYRGFPVSETVAILEAADMRWPGHLEARPFIEAIMDTAGRWSEAAALTPRDLSDDEDETVFLSGMLLKDGTRRPWLKSWGHEEGGRTTIYTEDTRRHVKARLEEIGLDDLIYCARGGGPLNYDNWMKRIWHPILDVARLCGGTLHDCDVREAPRKPRDSRSPHMVFCQNEKHGIPDPRPTPHDLRRTTLTSFGEEGMERHEIEAIAGHKPGSTAVAAYLVPRARRFDIAKQARQRG